MYGPMRVVVMGVVYRRGCAPVQEPYGESRAGTHARQDKCAMATRLPPQLASTSFPSRRGVVPLERPTLRSLHPRTSRSMARKDASGWFPPQNAPARITPK